MRKNPGKRNMKHFVQKQGPPAVLDSEVTHDFDFESNMINTNKLKQMADLQQKIATRIKEENQEVHNDI